MALQPLSLRGVSKYMDILTFFFQEGCEEGSMILITENAYMNKEAWKDMTPKFVEGYRNMTFVRDNTNCYFDEGTFLLDH